RVARTAAESRAGGPRFAIEYRIIRTDGEVRVIRGEGERSRDEPGRPRRMFGTVQDISERKRAERALVESLGLLNAVIEGTSDAVYVKDLDGRSRLINPSGARLVGRSVEEVLGQDDRALFAPESADRLIARDRQILASGSPQTFEEPATAAGVTRTYL